MKWQSSTTYLNTCLVDCHPCLIVVNTRQYHVHPRLALSVTYARLESLKAFDCCDVHGVAFKLDIRVDAAQRFSSSIRLCQTRLLRSEEKSVHVGQLHLHTDDPFASVLQHVSQMHDARVWQARCGVSVNVWHEK